MSAFDYAKAQNTALALIGKFGQVTSFARITVGTYDPVTGDPTDLSVQMDSVTVVSLPASGGTVQAFDNRFTEDLRKGKVRFFYVAAKGMTLEPQPGDLLYFEGALWELAGATPLNPAGTPVLFTFGCKPSGKDPALLGLPATPVDPGSGNLLPVDEW